MAIDHQRWSHYGITPLWIHFDNTPYGRSSLVLEALKSWPQPRLFEQNGVALIPLRILTNVTRERILKDLVEQLEQLHDAFQSAEVFADLGDHRWHRRLLLMTCNPANWIEMN